MAAVWDGEGQVSAAAGERPVAVEWHDAEEFKEVSGHVIALSEAVGVERLKVEATPSPMTDHKFHNEFDDAGLREAGFSRRMPFEQCVNVIRDAMKGTDSMDAEVTTDGSDAKLDIEVSVASFSTEYTLPLKRSALGRSDKLAAELCTANQLLSAARIELDQMATALGDAVADGDLAKQRLAAAKATIQKMQAEMDALSAEIRVRDGRIAKLESVATTIEPKSHSKTKPRRKRRIAKPKHAIDSALKFKFDVATAKGMAIPGQYQVSEDLLTATKKESSYAGHILLTPSIDAGIHSLQLRVGKRTGLFAVAVVDKRYKPVSNGCCFFDNGNVLVSGSHVAKSQSFGRMRVGFEKDDVVTLTIDMESFKFTIKSPYGSYEQKWQPRKTPVRVAVRMYENGTSLSIVN